MATKIIDIPAQIEVEKSCLTCMYKLADANDSPCDSCTITVKKKYSNHWRQSNMLKDITAVYVEETDKYCDTCKYSALSAVFDPCDSCNRYRKYADKWEPKV